FCDGFDDAAFKVDWNVFEMNGNISPSVECVFHGARSAHASFDPLPPLTPASAQINENASGQPSEVFIRVFARVDSAPDGARIVTVRPPEPSTDELFIGFNDGTVGVNGSVAVPTTRAPFAPGRWNCIEWELQTGGSMHVWVEGTDLIDG